MYASVRPVEIGNTKVEWINEREVYAKYDGEDNLWLNRIGEPLHLVVAELPAGSTH